MIALALAVTAAQVQSPAPLTDQLARLTAVHARMVTLARQAGDAIWPAFRPDTIPVLYVLPDHGTLLLGWRGAAPEGFSGNWRPWSASDAGAASTGTEMGGRRAAQVVVHAQSDVELLGLTVHEAFHVFQAAVRAPGKRFGQGENSFLVSRYPVFDVANEAALALEGRLLAAAARAPDGAARRALARQFLAVRESRQRALGAELATFEQMVELNEGLAEYALLRAQELATGNGDVAGRATRLEHLTDDVVRSIRLRYYATGPAQAYLLDALAGPSWKTRLVAENLTLQDAIAEASGYRDPEHALRRQAEATFQLPALRSAADTGVRALRSLRRAQLDSVLAAPGIVVEVIVAGRPIGLCGIDPQNLLQVDQGVLLHTRWVRPCVGDALQATFNTPMVQDGNAGRLTAVVGPESAVRVTVAGQAIALDDGRRLEGASDVRLESPVFSLQAAKADVSRSGRVVTVRIVL